MRLELPQKVELTYTRATVRIHEMGGNQDRSCRLAWLQRQSVAHLWIKM